MNSWVTWKDTISGALIQTLDPWSHKFGTYWTATCFFCFWFIFGTRKGEVLSSMWPHCFNKRCQIWAKDDGPFSRLSLSLKKEITNPHRAARFLKESSGGRYCMWVGVYFFTCVCLYVRVSVHIYTYLVYICIRTCILVYFDMSLL
jgi:hypothetical protein